MKYMRVLKILGAALVLSLLMAIVPVVPVQAANDIVLSPVQGKIGDTIHITGSAFSPSTENSEKHAKVFFAVEQVSIASSKYINIDVNTYKIVADTIVGYTNDADEGEFNTSFIVPASLTDGSTTAEVAQGTYYVYVTVISGEPASTLIKSVASFTVTPGATLDAFSPATGPAGTQVTITGANFPASATLVIKFDDAPIAITSGDTVTKSSGILISTITIPTSATTGTHNITIIAGTSTVTSTFAVITGATLDPIQPTSGPVGANVTVSGANFAASTPIVFKLDTTTITQVTGDTSTRSSGIFLSHITIPSTAAGAHNISVTVGSVSVTAPFTVSETSPATTPPPTTPPPTTPPPTTPAPSATSGSLSPSSTGAVGSDLIVTGVGFKVNTKVSVKYDEQEVATPTTTPQGILIATIKVPAGKSGAHNISASDGTNTLKLTYTVESTPPKIPQPIKPEMGVSAKAPVTFDWEDVTDTSAPVTYNLQVASASDFSTSSLVLDKTAIANSEYMLTEAEELKLEGQTSRLFWRIKSVDAALNESDWTGAGEFAISQPFKFTGWPLYVAIGVGVVLIFLFGFWMGRRTAFYY